MTLEDKAEVVEMLTEAYMGIDNLAYLATDNLTREDLKARKEEVGGNHVNHLTDESTGKLNEMILCNNLIGFARPG